MILAATLLPLAVWLLSPSPSPTQKLGSLIVKSLTRLQAQSYFLNAL